MFIASPPPFFIFSIIYVQANFVPNYVEEFYKKQKILGGLFCAASKIFVEEAMAKNIRRKTFSM